jgi:opacity protein-like surface antigen
VRKLRAAAVLAAVIALPALAADPAVEQRVTPITPGEQRVEPLAMQGEQRVEHLDQAGLQGITGGTKSRTRRTAEGVGKVVLGVVAAAVAIGATAASLLLF